MKSYITGSDLANVIRPHATVLVSWLGFEERTLAILRSIPRDSYPEIHAVRFREIEYDVNQHMAEFIKISGDRLVGVTEVNRSDQYDLLRAYGDIFDSAGAGEKNIVVDISAMPRDALLLSLYAAFKRKERLGKLSLLYNLAAAYGFSAANQKTHWISKGVTKISSVLGYSGKIVPGRDSVVIALVGFEHDRLNRVLESIEPAGIYVGIGTTEDVSFNWLSKTNREFAASLASRFHVRGEFEFDCDSVDDVRRRILATAREIGDKNIILVPMNTKIATFAAGLCSIENRAIQICYSPAMIYNVASHAKASDKYVYVRDALSTVNH